MRLSGDMQDQIFPLEEPVSFKSDNNLKKKINDIAIANGRFLKLEMEMNGHNTHPASTATISCPRKTKLWDFIT